MSPFIEETEKVFGQICDQQILPYREYVAAFLECNGLSTEKEINAFLVLFFYSSPAMKNLYIPKKWDHGNSNDYLKADSILISEHPDYEKDSIEPEELKKFQQEFKNCHSYIPSALNEQVSTAIYRAKQILPKIKITDGGPNPIDITAALHRQLIFLKVIDENGKSSRNIESLVTASVLYITQKEPNKARFCQRHLYARLYTPFIKSLLKGEYISRSNFSEILEACEKRQRIQGTLNNYTCIDIHFQQICKVVHQTCRSMSGSIEQQTRRRIIIRKLSEMHATKNDLTVPVLFRDVALGIFDMSMLDLIFVTTQENVHLLLEVCENLERLKGCLSYPDEESSEIISALEIARLKTSLILKAMISQTACDEDIEATMHADEYVAEVDEMLIGYNDLNRDTFKFAPHAKCYDGISKRMNKFIKHTNYKDKLQDILRYNQHSDKGISSFLMDKSGIYPLIKDRNIEKIMQTLNHEIQSSRVSGSKVYIFKNYSPYILTKLVELITVRLDQDMKNNKTVDQKIFEILRSLLFSIQYICDQYEDGNNLVDNQPRHYFEKSIYVADLKNNSFSQKEIVDIGELADLQNGFFCAALHSSPVNIIYLKRFARNYTTHAEVLNSIFHDRSIEKSAERFEVKFNEKFERNAESIDNRFNTERTRNIQLLGILAAFIAFVSMMAIESKTASDYASFFIYSGTFAICIVMFVFAIKHLLITPNLNWKEHKCAIIWHSVAYSIFIALIASLVIVTTQKYRKETDKAEARKSIEQEQTQLQQIQTDLQNMQGGGDSNG